MSTARKQNRKFTPPEAAGTPNPGNPSEAEQWEEAPVLTLGGKPIPEDIAHLVPYANTDQGIAERAAKRKYEPSGITFGRDPVDKKLDRMADFDEYDPLKEISGENERPGFVHRMLSPTVIKKRGMRGWKPVLGGDGQPVKHGELILAEMPTQVKEKRQRRLAAINREELDRANEEYAEVAARAIRDSGATDIAPLTAGDHLKGFSPHMEDGEFVGYDEGAETSIGRSSSRGGELAA